jgi:hypothetical protein
MVIIDRVAGGPGEEIHSRYLREQNVLAIRAAEPAMLVPLGADRDLGD